MCINISNEDSEELTVADCLPSYCTFCLMGYRSLRWELQLWFPLTNVVVGGKRTVWGERRVAVDHFIEDYPKTPPVTLGVISFLAEYLWGDVVWCAHCGERQFSSPSTPAFSLIFRHIWVLDNQTFFLTFWLDFQLVFVILRAVRLLKTSAQPKICQLDMTSWVKENIIGLDISEKLKCFNITVSLL